MTTSYLNRRRFLTALAAVYLTGCRDKLHKLGPRSLNLRQEWFAYSGFAGEVLAADQYAPALGLRLNVRPGSDLNNPLNSVLTRTDDVGVASVDLVIESIAKGSPLVVIGVVNDVSPSCFLTRKSSGIDTPFKFPGHRVGILPGTNTEPVYELMMMRNGIDRRSVKEVEVPGDVPTFVLGKYDIRPAFIYDEPVTLAKDGVSIDIIKPSDYKVNFLGTVYFTRREVVDSRREDLIALLISLVRAWRQVTTSAGQALAIGILKRSFPEIDTEKESKSLELGAPYFAGPAGTNRPLSVTPSHWDDTLTGLVELGRVRPGALTVDKIWDHTLLDQAYDRIDK